MHTRAAFNWGNTPPRASRGHDSTQGVGAHEAVPVATLLLAQPIEGARITNFNRYRPAVAVFAQDVVGTQGPIGGDQGLDCWGWFSLPSPFGGAGGITPEHHDADEAPRPYRVPQSAPGLYLRASGCGMGCPTLGRLGQGLGRAAPGAFFARRAPALFRRRRWHRVACGTGWKPPHNTGRIGKLPDIVLGRRAPSSQAPDLTPGQRLGDEIEDGTSQLTAGTIRHVAFLGLSGLERKFKTDRDTERVAGPPRERKAHDGQHEVHAPQRAVFLAG
jgi:hypothetical protein